MGLGAVAPRVAAPDGGDSPVESSLTQLPVEFAQLAVAVEDAVHAGVGFATLADRRDALVVLELDPV